LIAFVGKKKKRFNAITMRKTISHMKRDSSYLQVQGGKTLKLLIYSSEYMIIEIPCLAKAQIEILAAIVTTIYEKTTN
jgi:hypothetical protein